jgi:hypothetical protein
LPLKEPPSKSNLCESFLESFLLYWYAKIFW